MFYFAAVLVMWPSGEARVCKTFHGGSTPSMTSLTFYSYDKQTETKAVFPYGLLL